MKVIFIRFIGYEVSWGSLRIIKPNEPIKFSVTNEMKLFQNELSKFRMKIDLKIHVNQFLFHTVAFSPWRNSFLYLS
jgi:hypothetical protein